jgi:hypothetical protein
MTTSDIVVTVTDTTGAVAPGAKVTAHFGGADETRVVRTVAACRSVKIR